MESHIRANKVQVHDIVSRKRTPSSIDLSLGDCICQLAVKDELEILGVIIDSKLSWSKHISSIASRAGQKLGALRKVANKLDIRGRWAVYKAQVRSIMEYACLCWISASSTTLSQLDNIQRKCTKDHRCKLDHCLHLTHSFLAWPIDVNLLQ